MLPSLSCPIDYLLALLITEVADHWGAFLFTLFSVIWIELCMSFWVSYGILMSSQQIQYTSQDKMLTLTIDCILSLDSLQQLSWWNCCAGFHSDSHQTLSLKFHSISLSCSVRLSKRRVQSLSLMKHSWNFPQHCHLRASVISWSSLPHSPISPSIHSAVKLHVFSTFSAGLLCSS